MCVHNKRTMKTRLAGSPVLVCVALIRRTSIRFFIFQPRMPNNNLKYDTLTCTSIAHLMLIAVVEEKNLTLRPGATRPRTYAHASAWSSSTTLGDL